MCVRKQTTAVSQRDWMYQKTVDCRWLARSRGVKSGYLNKLNEFTRLVVNFGKFNFLNGLKRLVINHDKNNYMDVKIWQI